MREPWKDFWVCVQLGAREHYAIPRALRKLDCNVSLFTDAWVPPRNVLGWTCSKMRERYHADLASVPVSAWNLSLIALEISARARRITDWRQILIRNRWFQANVIESLKALPKIGSPTGNGAPVIFAYSYAARKILEYAKEQGWTTVLGQIDPGVEEENVVRGLVAKRPEFQVAQHLAPLEYWDSWRKECELADHIVVNSRFSGSLLQEAGVGLGKTHVVPLAFEASARTESFVRTYPDRFTRERPLRALFLGQVLLRKGVAEIFEAARELVNDPVEFWFVGPMGIDLPQETLENSALRWFGPAQRSETARYYREADVFLFPTWSDGFGLTQLEAQAWRLPVIASRFCGEVVQHGSNGWLLPEVSGAAIASRLRECLQHPEALAAAAAESGVAKQFSLSAVGSALTRMISK